MSGDLSLPRLLAPGRVGLLETRNWTVMVPMGSDLEEDDHVGRRIKRYDEGQGRGGVGLIIVAVGAIAFPTGACIPS